jgi:prepilin-type N-terminal cleavage/methylation domain-containing protein
MRGVTLVETLVVVTIFSILVAAILQSFSMAMTVQGKIIKDQEILDELNYALEYMGKALRMAKKDDILFGGQTLNCLVGDNVNYYVTSSESEIRFRNSQNQCQRFYLSDGKIFEEKGYQLPLTSPKIKITSLKFKVSGESQTDNLQPLVTIIIEAETREKNPSKVKVQTTVSQRDLDVVLER